MENNWSYSFDNVLYYVFKFNINQDNYVQLITDIDDTILILGEKYGLFTLLSGIGSINLDSLRKEYIQNKIEYLNKRTNDLTLRCFEWGKWPRVKDEFIEKGLLDKIKIMEIFYFKNGELVKSRLSTEEWEKLVLTTNNPFKHGYWISNFYEEMYHYPIDLGSSYFAYDKIASGQQSLFAINLKSIFNIWFQNVDINEGNESLLFQATDNRDIAICNTPKFNSLLRDLKLKFIGLGADFAMDNTMSDIKYVTEDGILIDGQIIYQEDIENGKISIPKYRMDEFITS